MNILIVERDQEIRESLKLCLEELMGSVSVDCAESTEQALSLCGDKIYDVGIIDFFTFKLNPDPELISQRCHRYIIMSSLGKLTFDLLPKVPMIPKPFNFDDLVKLLTA